MKKEKGFTLLVSIVVTSALLLIGLVVINVAFKQLLISGAGEESQYAFYAADGGTECAVYWDLKGIPTGTISPFDPSTGGSITCNGQTISTASQSGATAVPTLPTGTASLIGGGGANRTSIFWLSFTKGCAIVQVTKNADGTTQVDSRGYNTCDTSSPKRFERGVTLTY